MENEDWQYEYIEYFNKNNIFCKRYNAKQLNLKYKNFDAFLIKKNILWIEFYEINNIDNKKNILKLFKHEIFQVKTPKKEKPGLVLLYLKENSTFTKKFTPENIIKFIEDAKNYYNYLESKLTQMDQYGEVLNFDDIEKYIPQVLDLSKDSLGRLDQLIEHLQKVREKSINGVEIEESDLILEHTDKVNNGNQKSIEEEITEIVGLAEVKTHLAELESKMNIDQIRQEHGLKTNQRSLHTIFLGNPGTGKTTVARLFGRILKEYGILEKGHVVEVTRKDLVAEFSGQTPPKTAKKIEEAFGGIFFIDEAYSLVQDKQDQYGNEAIDTILKAMEDYRDKFIIIAAGYPKPMQNFIDANPGLKSRFTEKFNFMDYSIEELLEIGNIIIANHDYMLDEDAEHRFKDIITYIFDNKDDNFGNARVVRNIIEDTIQNQNFRLSSYIKENGKPDGIVEMLKTIKSEDFDLSKIKS